MMRPVELVVKTVPSRRDAFIAVPQPLVDELRPLSSPSSLGGQFVPVTITVVSCATGQSASTTGTPLFVGALVTRSSSSDRVVEIGPSLCRDLGINDGDIVEISSATGWKVARRLELAPVDVNESEVVEKNAMVLQNNLMQTLRVLSLGQRITLRTPTGICALVEVLQRSTITTPANAPCYVLTEGTELHIAVKMRDAAQSSPSVSPPLPGKLKLISSSMLTNLPSFHTHSSSLSLTEQLINSTEPRPASVAGSLCAEKLVNGTDASIFINAAAAKELLWSDGLLVGYYNVAALLWLNGETANSSPTSPSTTTSLEFGACNPDFLREHSVLGRVRIVDGPYADVSAKVGSHRWAVLPALLEKVFPHEAITIVAVPNPPTQLFGRRVGCGEGTNRNGSIEALQELSTVLLHPSGKTKLHVPRHLSNLHNSSVEAVHGSGLLDELSNALSISPTSASRLFNGNVIVVGPRGSGKSTIVCRAALSSGRHTIYVDCQAAPATIGKTVNAAIAQASACSPSVIVLDGLDAIASAASTSAQRGPTQLSSATLHMIYNWLVGTARCYGDVSFVATAHSYDELTPICKLPQCFPTVLKMPSSLLTEGKYALVEQLVTIAVSGRPMQDTSIASSQQDAAVVLPAAVLRHGRALSRHIASNLAPLLDNYSAADIYSVTRKVVRQCQANASRATMLAEASAENTTAVERGLHSLISPQTIEAVVASFIPQSRAGISFLNTVGGEGSKVASWDDAGGLKEAKAALYDVLVLPSKYPQIFKNLPLKSKAGVLLHGPSGCGKTFLISVVAAAENLHCIVVNGPEIFGKYIGTSEQKIREIFENAQAAAPCVVFFDEFDSVAPRRGNSNTGVTDRVVNQLLCYLDGVESRSDVYVVAATSRPDLIDPALLRPGRLDRHVECPMPSASDRKEIFAAHLKNASEGGAILGEEGLTHLADLTEGWTSADIAGLVSSAHTQLLQKYMKVTVGSLLENNEDDIEGAEAGAEDPFHVLELPTSHLDPGSKKRRHKTVEALRRVAQNHTKVDEDASNPSADPSSTPSLPTLQVADLQEAMLTFSRSRQVEDKPTSKSSANRSLTQQLVGTRQTSQ